MLKNGKTLSYTITLLSLYKPLCTHLSSILEVVCNILAHPYGLGQEVQVLYLRYSLAPTHHHTVLVTCCL